VGWIRKSSGKTYIEIEQRYQPALMGVEELRSIWVLYWFDRNDTPEKRSVLQVHPRGNPDNPLRGVFATRSPLRPNLIALSQVGHSRRERQPDRNRRHRCLCRYARCWI
jgi:tRNA (Thr-GGU) A37 N-methylase